MSSLADLLAADGFKKPNRCPRPRSDSMPGRSDSMPQTRKLNTGNRRLSLSEELHRPATHRNISRNSMPQTRKSVDLISTPSSSDDSVAREEIKPKTSYKNELYEEEQHVVVSPVISILIRFLSRFFEEERFRRSIYKRCASCFLSSEDVGPVATLKRSIMTVEHAMDGHATAHELKKASLQLSVITSLGSAELKNAYTSGVANTHLAACAHIYLAVIYKYNNKDAISAKHLLQVFIDCPNWARTLLLTELWDRIFLAHFSHLMEWYFKNEESARVDEVYNASLDTGTYEFAKYYKEWVVKGVEPKELPCVPLPDDTCGQVSRFCSGEEESPRMSVSGYKAVVSRELYESVLGMSATTRKSCEIEIVEEEYGLRSPDRLSLSSSDDEWSGARKLKESKRRESMSTRARVGNRGARR